MNTINPDFNQGQPVIHITNFSECYYCRASIYNDSIVYCPACGFPQRGKEEEQKQFILDKRLDLTRQENLESGIKKTRWCIAAIALLYALNYLLIGIETREIIYASIEA